MFWYFSANIRTVNFIFHICALVILNVNYKEEIFILRVDGDEKF